MRALRRLWDALLDLLYPRDCVICGHRVDRPKGHLCTTCRAEQWPERHATCSICAAESANMTQEHFVCHDCMQHRPLFEKAFVALRYYSNVRQLIQTFKYQQGLWLIHDFTHFLEVVYWDQIFGQGIHIDALVPVPTYRAKLRKRGYNQAECLANALAKRLGLPCYKRILCRLSTKIWAQARLQRKERFSHAKKAYAIRKPMDLSGKTILLIDDVMTTGSTVNACATHLKHLGAKVYVLVLARPIFG